MQETKHLFDYWRLLVHIGNLGLEPPKVETFAIHPILKQHIISGILSYRVYLCTSTQFIPPLMLVCPMEIFTIPQCIHCILEYDCLNTMNVKYMRIWDLNKGHIFCFTYNNLNCIHFVLVHSK